MHVTTVGLDLAKNVLQVHGVTIDGDVAFNRSLRRGHAPIVCFNAHTLRKTGATSSPYSAD